VKQTFSSINDRRKFWEKVLQGRIAELVFSGQEQQAKSELEKELKNSADGSEVGEVYLVGGGPGDPDLLTFRALRLMQQADVIVHDRLVSPEVLDLVRRDAVRIYAGKEKDKHAIPQDQINTLLVKLAKEGKRVCRLKGGDPFIFGRGGEEIELLAKEQIPFQVVPGITAAAGCASYAGIPLTHRDYSQSVAFVTGHLKDGNFNLNWDGIAKPNQTLVIYMGLVGIKDLCKELIAHGLKEDMPVALVQQGTTRHQRVIVGDLLDMPAKVKANKIKAPTLIIVGEVVKLRESLNWFHPEEN
jgi:uroporphyrin-III C-methyltransferase/precorrin-2 dehydrogenase/sirohydrochlorin ferrochelatase